MYINSIKLSIVCCHGSIYEFNMHVTRDYVNICVMHIDITILVLLYSVHEYVTMNMQLTTM